MPQEIYNEGRVVGFSAYEIFVKHCLASGVPEEDIPDENTWLTSMIGIGASMVLKIPAGTTQGVHDYPLPNGSNLTAAGVIFANPFLGSCDWDTTTSWAKRVTSYSSLIQNTSSSNPPTSDGKVPFDANYTGEEYSESIADFVKITDGIIFTKDATWIRNADNTPYKDIDPNFSNSSTIVRLYINEDIISDVFIIFTGFLNKSVLNGISKYAISEDDVSEHGSTDIDENDWANGGMLGPEVIPWANKIIFSVPSALLNINAELLYRTIPSDATYTPGVKYGFTIKDNAINSPVNTNSLIDLNSINLNDYYTVHSSEFTVSPTLEENVTDMTLGAADSYSELIAWYPGMSATKINATTSNANFFPPALYAIQVTTTGNHQKLIPLDTAAPGTVKGFSNSTQAFNYTQLMPYNYAIYYNPTTNVFNFVNPTDNNVDNWSGTAKITYISGDYPKVEISAGAKKTQTIALTDSNNTPYNVNGTSGNITLGPSDNLNWDTLLKALKTNKSVDLLGTTLHNFATELDSTSNIGISNVVNYTGSRWLLLNPDTESSSHIKSTSVWVGSEVEDDLANTRYVTLNSGETPATVRLGSNFIRFKGMQTGDPDIKLYISTREPTDTAHIPVGSIGIGW